MIFLLLAACLLFFQFFYKKPKCELIGEKLKITLWLILLLNLLAMIPVNGEHFNSKAVSFLILPFFIATLFFCYTAYKNKQKRREIAPTKAHRIGLTLTSIGASLPILALLSIPISKELSFFDFSTITGLSFIALGILLLSGVVSKFIDISNKFIHWISKGD